MEEERFTCLRGHTVGLNAALSALEQQLAALRAAADAHTAARIARDGVVPAMQTCREHCDALERMLNAAVWPLPSELVPLSPRAGHDHPRPGTFSLHSPSLPRSDI